MLFSVSFSPMVLYNQMKYGVLRIMILFGSILSCLSLANADELRGLKVGLISENLSIAPGSKFTIGIKIQHQKGYHTYWKNPGIVGLATNARWDLPDGFVAGDIQWPAPELCDMAGHPCHGYERDVVLLVEITAPAKLQVKSITLNANLSWMCCAESCFPGSKKLSLTLPVSAKPVLNAEHLEIFSKARTEIPQATKKWKLEILSKADQKIIALRLIPEGANQKAPSYIFSTDGQISSNKKQVFRKSEDGSYLLKIERSDLSPSKPKQFSAVLKTEDENFYLKAHYDN